MGMEMRASFEIVSRAISSTHSHSHSLIPRVIIFYRIYFWFC